MLDHCVQRAQQVDRLQSCFRILDLDKDNTIGRTELLRVIGAEPTRFALDIFRIFDTDGNGNLDFVEFVGAVTKVCTADRGGLERFAFRIVDTNGSGRLDFTELQRVVTTVYGKSVDDGMEAGHMFSVVGRENSAKVRTETAEVVLKVLDGDNSGVLTVS